MKSLCILISVLVSLVILLNAQVKVAITYYDYFKFHLRVTNFCLRDTVRLSEVPVEAVPL